MLPTVAEKTVQDIPVVMLPEAEVETPRKRKYVAIAVSVVAVVAILIGGFVAGMYLTQKASNDQRDDLIEVMNFKYMDQNGKAVQQVVKVDTKRNETQIEVKKDDDGFKMINDFQRGFTVYRTTSDGEADCYVALLNRTQAMNPEVLAKYKDQHPAPDSLPSVRDEQKFTPAEEPIADPSFLGKSAREMCKGLDVYWLYPATEHDRQKRRRRFHCHFGCAGYVSCCPWRAHGSCWLRCHRH